MKKYRQIIAVVPAAGIGSRMKADKPKQYLEIQGKTILEHTLHLLLSHEAIEHIVVAVSPEDRYCTQLEILKQDKITLVQGGETRADSVLNALAHIRSQKQDNQDIWVLVHDAARPCLTLQDIDNLLLIEDIQGAILAIPVTDTVKRADSREQIQNTEDRSQLWLAQTPQFFQAELLYGALLAAQENGSLVTDEASAMELAGFRPHLVAGRRDNIKVTCPEDLALAQFYLTNN